METNLSKHNPSLKNFYRQLSTYLVVMLFLAFLNYLRFNGHWWVIWPAIGWGLAILLQGIHVLFPSEEN